MVLLSCCCLFVCSLFKKDFTNIYTMVSQKQWVLLNQKLPKVRRTQTLRKSPIDILIFAKNGSRKWMCFGGQQSDVQTQTARYKVSMLKSESHFSSTVWQQKQELKKSLFLSNKTTFYCTKGIYLSWVFESSFMNSSKMAFSYERPKYDICTFDLKTVFLVLLWDLKF